MKKKSYNSRSLKKKNTKLFISVSESFSFDYLLLLPLLLVLVLVFVCAAIFVLHLFPLLVSVFFVRGVPVKFYNTQVN